jgi:hypothetical protein
LNLPANSFSDTGRREGALQTFLNHSQAKVAGKKAEIPDIVR